MKEPDAARPSRSLQRAAEPHRKALRRPDELRPVRIERGFLRHPEGSVLISVGDTRVICTASIENGVPPFLRGTGRGWLTAEYGMLPRATAERTPRDAARGRVNGRSVEIQRLVGRALRSVVELDRLGERTVWLDCDVIQADGGTRTASVTGAFVALVEALAGLWSREGLPGFPVKDFIAATSAGIVQGWPLLDLEYGEDSQAQVDLNVVATGRGELVEVQGTAEGVPCPREDWEHLLDLALAGIAQLVQVQREALGALAAFVPGGGSPARGS